LVKEAGSKSKNAKVSKAGMGEYNDTSKGNGTQTARSPKHSSNKSSRRASLGDGKDGLKHTSNKSSSRTASLKNGKDDLTNKTKDTKKRRGKNKKPTGSLVFIFYLTTKP
jgi:hypothetical protein